MMSSMKIRLMALTAAIGVMALASFADAKVTPITTGGPMTKRSRVAHRSTVVLLVRAMTPTTRSTELRVTTY